MKFYNINAKDVETHHPLFGSMHHLRWKMFHKTLEWKKGLESFNGMEHDNYDNEHAQHIVAVDDANIVQACCRLIPTTTPYMIDECCKERVTEIPMPHCDKIWEITRFACAPKVSGFRGFSLPAHLTTAILEYGISHNISKFIAWTTMDVKKMISIVGWDPVSVGPEMNTDEGVPSEVCLYSSNKNMLDYIRTKHGITQSILFSVNDQTKPILDQFRDNLDNKNNHYSRFCKNFISRDTEYPANIADFDFFNNKPPSYQNLYQQAAIL